MTESGRILIDDTMRGMAGKFEAVFNQGIVEGAKLVKNLIVTNEGARDIDTLLQSLDLFIEQYDIVGKANKEEAGKEVVNTKEEKILNDAPIEDGDDAVSE